MPEKPLDPADGPLQAFACELRALRTAANLSYRAMALRANYSHVALVRAAGGRSLPSWSVTEHFVRACGVTDDELKRWKQRWNATKEAVRAERLADTSGTAKCGYVETDHNELTESVSFGREVVGETSARPYVPAAGEIQTLADYARALQKLKASVGNRSYKQMERLAEHRVPASTLADLCNPARRWLDWSTVRVFLEVCEVRPSDMRVWDRALEEATANTERLIRSTRESLVSPPPEVKIDSIQTPAEYVLAMRGLMRDVGISWEKLIDRARHHPGSWIYGRSTLSERLKVAESNNILPDRDLVESFVRGCYCNNSEYPSGCKSDCHADDVQRWLSGYDRLQQASIRETDLVRSSELPVATVAQCSTSPRRSWVAIVTVVVIVVGVTLTVWALSALT